MRSDRTVFPGRTLGAKGREGHYRAGLEGGNGPGDPAPTFADSLNLFFVPRRANLHLVLGAARLLVIRDQKIRAIGPTSIR